jgi:hypothetical protein
MDVLDIDAQTNGTFVQSFNLIEWCDLYDFSTGHWHAMLRKAIDNAIAHYEWSTEGGNIFYADTRAHGEITFTTNPEIGETLMIGATIVEFGATDGVVIGLTRAETVANLLAYLNASTDPDIVKCTYNVISGAILNIEYMTSGTLGNAFPIAVGVSGATKSGDTLSGGGAVLTLTAPVADVGEFTGEYVYDVRWQSDAGLLVPVVGGAITFTPGVTRDTSDEPQGA